MNLAIKNYLGIAGIVALVALAVSSLLYAGTYTKTVDPSTFRSFSVSGTGEVTAIPDVGKISFTVVTEGGTDIASLRDQNAEKANAIIAFVKEQGVADEDIKTANYQLSPRYQSSSCSNRAIFPEQSDVCPPPEIVGYTIRQTTEVDVRDFSIISNLLSGAVDRGANTISGPFFTIDDPEEVQAQARQEAIEKAQAKAEELADAAGFRVGRLLSIDEGGFYPRMDYAFGLGGAESGAATKSSVAPAIEPGSQDVSVSVTLRYEIR